MKKNLLVIISTFFAFSLLTACRGDEPSARSDENGGTGYLKLSEVSIDAVVEAHPFGRSVDAINIEIIDSEGSQVRSYPYSEIAGKTLALPAGVYNVRAEAGDNVEAAFASPYYEGELNDLEIKNNLVSEPDPIECRLANVKVTVRISPKLRAQLSDDATVTVTNMLNDAALTFTLTECDAETAGYFGHFQPDMQLVAVFNATMGTTPITATTVCTEVVRGQHRILTYALKDDTGFEEGCEPSPGDDEPVGGTSKAINKTIKIECR